MRADRGLGAEPRRAAAPERRAVAQHARSVPSGLLLCRADMPREEQACVRAAALLLRACAERGIAAAMCPRGGLLRGGRPRLAPNGRLAAEALRVAMGKGGHVGVMHELAGMEYCAIGEDATPSRRSGS